jgi:hypothetical protein
MSITNDEAMDSVRDAMTMIDTTSYEAEDDWKEAKTLVLRLRETIEWIENVVDGDWQDEQENSDG